MDWFLYDKDLCHERDKLEKLKDLFQLLLLLTMTIEVGANNRHQPHQQGLCIFFFLFFCLFELRYLQTSLFTSILDHEIREI